MMMDGKIRSILIVGGGTAGWMSAAYLAKALPDVKVTVVESSDIPVIGVGEATIASFQNFTNFLEMKEADWMPACNGSYKYAIRFRDWYAKGDSYWHPFESLIYPNASLHVGQFWFRNFVKGGQAERENFYRDCYVGTRLLEQNKVLANTAGLNEEHQLPLGGGAHPVSVRVPHAYHFDAGLFGQYLKERIAKPMGVEQIIDDVVDVHLDERGYIDELATKTGKRLRADLFVDCSGFRSLLIEKTLKEPFDSYAKTLFINSAIAMRVPYQDVASEMRPYTTTTALSAGWVWNIPVTERVGTGYVYCKDFMKPDDAEAEFRRHVGEARASSLDARHIDVSKIGKHRRTWVRNCVAVGLSSGFLEPLESTALQFVYAKVDLLAVSLADRNFNTGSIAAFNRYVTAMMEEARDFIAAHYALTSREDTPFWKAVKYETVIPESLANRLANSRESYPNRPWSGIIFQENSWMAVLLGMNYLAADHFYKLLQVDDAAFMRDVLGQIRSLTDRVAASALPHHEYLARFIERH
jgi:tryptophan halogenase